MSIQTSKFISYKGALGVKAFQLPGVPQRAMVEVEDRRAAHIECYITRGQNDECKITIDVDLARTLPQDEERYVNVRGCVTPNHRCEVNSYLARL